MWFTFQRWSQLIRVLILFFVRWTMEKQGNIFFIWKPKRSSCSWYLSTVLCLFVSQAVISTGPLLAPMHAKAFPLPWHCKSSLIRSNFQISSTVKIKALKSHGCPPFLQLHQTTSRKTQPPLSAVNLTAQMPPTSLIYWFSWKCEKRDFNGNLQFTTGVIQKDWSNNNNRLN